MLDLVQIALQANQVGFQRIDGQASLSQRKDTLDAFNNDPKVRVLLASIGAVGEG